METLWDPGNVMSNRSADDRHFVAFPQFQFNQAHIALPSQFARYGEAAKSIAMPIRRDAVPPSRSAARRARPAAASPITVTAPRRDLSAPGGFDMRGTKTRSCHGCDEIAATRRFASRHARSGCPAAAASAPSTRSGTARPSRASSGQTGFRGVQQWISRRSISR